MPLRIPLFSVSILESSFYIKLFFRSRRSSQFISRACPHILWHGLLRRDCERQEDQVWGPAEPDWRHNGTSHWILGHQWCWDSILCHEVLCWIYQIQNWDIPGYPHQNWTTLIFTSLICTWTILLQISTPNHPDKRIFTFFLLSSAVNSHKRLYL